MSPASLDERNQKFFDDMQLRLKCMTNKERRKRLRELSAKPATTLAESVELLAIRDSVTPHRAAEIILRELRSGKLQATGVKMPTVH